MNTLIEEGLSDWLSTLMLAAGRSEPVIAGSDDVAEPDQADGAFVRCVCQEDVHEIAGLWLPEFRIEICTPMLAGKTIAQHRALCSAVIGIFVDGNLAALSSAMQAASGRQVTGWFRLDQFRDSEAPRRADWWTEAPEWRIGMQEV